MGEEYGEEAPFLYFVSHSDPDLVEGVRQGRKAEFKEFHDTGEPPDVQDPKTFLQSKLNWEKRREGKHKVLFDLYRTLIKLRQEIPALKCRDRQSIEINSFDGEKIITLQRSVDDSEVLAIFNFSDTTQKTKLVLPEGNWQKILDSSDPQWMGDGSTLPQKLDPESTVTLPHQSFILYKVE
ncbi:MAG: DUF3459 domain-containing protein [Microcoleus sp.]|uniref:DUF3459 domain-containing protein n=1 Tax=Microcoleus sp. TaxID=44472 RepID=UPI003C73F67F